VWKQGNGDVTPAAFFQLLEIAGQLRRGLKNRLLVRMRTIGTDALRVRGKGV
jgi:hypothetical protein